MSKNEQFLYSIIEDYRRGSISKSEAAKVLGVSEKAVQRKAKAVRENGLRGIKHGNTGRRPVNRKCDELEEEVIALVKEHYYDFNITHAREMIEQRHGIHVSYGTFHKWCRKAGLGKSKRRRPSKARIHRERMANEGLMMQMDGSQHKWNGRDTWCLIAMIDDATSDIPYAEFFPEETTWACLKVLRNVIERRGIPYVIYTDRAGWAGTKREYFTQFKRACDDLGINLITTSSPQAKGRIENAWKTIQGRLVPEFRLHGIKSKTDANRYLQQTFLPLYWANRNTVVPRHTETRYRPLPSYMDLDNILCIQEMRVVGNDHTVSYLGQRYKILDKRFNSLRGIEVTVHQNEEGDVRIFYGNHELRIQKIIPPKRQWKRDA